ncbi:MAG: ankyrin repeat domain-containing protein [Gammaproteobacteria bacterium]|nr:ankyrin repeat domain-containing protein [Gammaproteobacteria bacterium]
MQDLSELFKLLSLQQTNNNECDFSDLASLFLFLVNDLSSAINLLSKISKMSDEKDVVKKQKGLNADKMLKRLRANIPQLLTVEFEPRLLAHKLAKFYGTDGLKRIFERNDIVSSASKEDEICKTMLQLVTSSEMDQSSKLEYVKYILSLKEDAGNYLPNNGESFTITDGSITCELTTFQLALAKGEESIVRACLQASDVYRLKSVYIKQVKTNNNNNKTDITDVYSHLMDKDRKFFPLLNFVLYIASANEITYSMQTVYNLIDLIFDEKTKERDLLHIIAFLCETESYDILEYLISKKNVSASLINKVVHYAFLPKKSDVTSIEKNDKLKSNFEFEYPVNIAYKILLFGSFDFGVNLIQKGFHDPVSAKNLLFVAINERDLNVVRFLLNDCDPFEDNSILALANTQSPTSMQHQTEREIGIFNLLLNKETSYPQNRNKQIVDLFNNQKIPIKLVPVAIKILFSIDLSIEINDDAIKVLKENLIKSGLLVNSNEINFYIFYSIMSFAKDDSHELVEILLKMGFNANCYYPVSKIGKHPCHIDLAPDSVLSILSYASSVPDIKMVKLLIKYGASFCRENSNEYYTPLIYSSIFGTPEIVSFLLDQGAKTSEHCLGNPSYPPLHYALLYKGFDQGECDSVIQLIVAKIQASADKKASLSSECFDNIRKLSKQNLVESIYYLMLDECFNSFMQDARLEDTYFLYLIIKGVSQQQALMNILKYINTKIQSDLGLVIPDNFGSRIFYLILDYYTQYLIQTKKFSSIDFATTSHIESHFLTLMPPDLKNKNTSTFTIDSENCRIYRLILIFLATNFNIDFKDVNLKKYHAKYPALLLASMINSDHLVALLVAKGASIESEISNYAIFMAARYGNLDMFKCLIKANAQIFKSDYAGLTALEIAVQYNHLNIVEYIIATISNLNMNEGYLLEQLKNAYRLLNLNSNPKIHKLLSAHIPPNIIPKLKNYKAAPIPLEIIDTQEKFQNYDPNKEKLFEFFAKKSHQRSFIKIDNQTLSQHLPDGGTQFESNMQFNQQMGLFGYRIVHIPEKNNSLGGAEYKMRLTGDVGKMRLLFFREEESKSVKISDGAKETIYPTFTMRVMKKH